MNRALQIARILGALCFAAFCFAGALVALQVRENIDVVTNNVIGAAEHFENLERDLDDRVNEFKPVVDGAQRVLLHAVPVEDAARDRVNELQPVMAHAVVVEDAARDRVNQLQVPIVDAGKVLTDTRVAVSNANKAAIDERFYFEQQAPATFERLNKAIDGVLPIEENVASATQHGDAVLGDVQFEADKIAHPAKKKLGFWGAVYAGAQAAHKFEPPLF